MHRVFVEQAICKAIGELDGALYLLTECGEECFGFEEEIRDAKEHLKSCLHEKS
jgi:hypothetical protein